MWCGLFLLLTYIGNKLPCDQLHMEGEHDETENDRFKPCGVILLATGLAGAGDTPDQKREKTRKMAAQTLKELYKLEPPSKGAIQNSAGYAVFNNMGTNLFLLSTARGAGIAVPPIPSRKPS